MSDELIALRKFLDGSAPLDGHWFSEKRPDVPGAFWWRHDLTAIDRAAAELATLRATITRLEGERDGYKDDSLRLLRDKQELMLRAMSLIAVALAAKRYVTASEKFDACAPDSMCMQLELHQSNAALADALERLEAAT